MESTPIKLKTDLSATPNSASLSTPSSSSDEKPVLRAGLKRTRHSFRSPLNVVKRLQIEDEPLGLKAHAVTEERDTDVSLEERRDAKACPHRKAESGQDLVLLCEELRKKIKSKSETLRRLKMVKMYRKKNDLTKLQRLIDKWRSCVHSVMYELQSELPAEGKVSLSQLVDNFGLDDKLLHFDRKEDDFIHS